MTVTVTAIGKFEYMDNDDCKIEMDVELEEMHRTDFTFAELITQEFERINKGGCGCTISEANNHCECDGYGYEYDYVLLNIKEKKQ